MNIIELIEQLEQFPADTEVIVDSYEEGFDPVTAARLIRIVNYPNRIDCYGIYDMAETGSENAREAILIYSQRRGEE